MSALRFVSFLVLLISVCAQAQNAAVLLEEDLIQQTKTFKKNIQIYHYFYAPAVDTQDPQWPKKAHDSLQKTESRLAWTNFYLSTRAGAFWDTNYHTTQFNNAGPGMYYAIDPDSSKEFGETAVVMNVPEGTRYLSVFKPVSLRRQTLQALIAENYFPTKHLAPEANSMALRNGFSGNTLRFMVLPENVKFRQLVIDIMTRQQISFIEYHYKSHLAGFCKVSNQAAFVFIGKNPNQHTSLDYINEAGFGASLTPTYQNLPLLTGYPLEERSPQETELTQLLSRFRYVLSQIRVRGTRAAKSLMFENLSQTEIDHLAGLSYECTRRH